MTCRLPMQVGACRLGSTQIRRRPGWPRAARLRWRRGRAARHPPPHRAPAPPPPRASLALPASSGQTAFPRGCPGRRRRSHLRRQKLALRRLAPTRSVLALMPHHAARRCAWRRWRRGWAGGTVTRGTRGGWDVSVSGCASRLVWTSTAPQYERAWANGRSQRGDVAS